MDRRSVGLARRARRGAGVVALALAGAFAVFPPVGAQVSLGRNADIPLSTRRGGISDECQSGRSKFHAWLDASHTADSARSHAHNQWAAEHAEEGLSGAELTTAIDAFNADLQTALALDAKADKKLAKLNKVRARCTVSTMPKQCRNEYAQYDPIIDNFTRLRASNEANSQAIAAEQDALGRGSRTDYNNAVQSQNAAARESNDIRNEYNVTLLAALNSAVDKCNDAY